MLQTIQQYFNKLNEENTLRVREYLVTTNLSSIDTLIWVEL